MLKSVFPKFVLFAALLLTNFFSFAAIKLAAGRTLRIAGLVVDAKTWLPVDGASIYDTDNHLLGATDKNGYYNIAMPVAPVGEIIFSLKIKKTGYHDIEQNDHWGNLSDGTKSLFYFGMKKKGDKVSAFSNLFNGSFNGDISYAGAESNFGKIKEQHRFDEKVEAAKAGNQNILIQIDGDYYIVNSTGWIKLKSEKDLILIDKKRVVAADKLNSLIKRDEIKGMTPISSPSAQFAIYTKAN